VPVIRRVRIKHTPKYEEQLPRNVWSDSVLHLGEERWPAAAVPLLAFSGTDRPRPRYRQEITILLKEDQYVNFGIRLRAGGGDHYMGGSVGLVYTPDRKEVQPGHEGQLVTILDIVINPDSTVSLRALGDLPFFVRQSWIPRGLRGLQCAVVETDQLCHFTDSILEACDNEEELTLFAALLRKVAPNWAALLSGQGSPYTVFVPQNKALEERVKGLADDKELEKLLGCHIVQGRVQLEGFYSGRHMVAIDGTPLTISFTTWPRNGPKINQVEVAETDYPCENGVIHIMKYPLQSRPVGCRPSQTTNFPPPRLD